MIERPILFSAPMVRALLAGTKTQTRRVLREQPQDFIKEVGWTTFTPPGKVSARGTHPDHGYGEWFLKGCPYGNAGDRLWVRETWYCDHMDCINKIPKDRSAHDAHADDSPLLYRADGECCEQIPECEHSGGHGAQWRPSIHMPRWASRVTLEVTSIRVERLQDISEADAQAEGATFTDFGKERGCQRPGWSMVGATRSEQCLGSARFAFANLWNQINGKRAAEDEVSPAEWDGNPWVWVVNFKRVEGGQ